VSSVASRNQAFKRKYLISEMQENDFLQRAMDDAGAVPASAK